MSTFLEICQDLRREAGISGTGPSSVTSQTGEMQRVVEWVLMAYRTVQNLHPCWQFLQADFSFSTIANVSTYTRASIPLDELGSWKTDTLMIYLTSDGINGQMDLDYLPWDDFAPTYQRGSTSTQTGKPTLFTVKPDQSLLFWPIPDAVYTIDGEYFKRAQTMTAGTDEPLIPSQFHDVILWRALMYYGAFAAADEKYTHGQNEYGQVLAALEANQLPAFQLGDALT